MPSLHERPAKRPRLKPLELVEDVKESTVKLGEVAITAFVHWLTLRAGFITIDSMLNAPQLLDLVGAKYISYLYVRHIPKYLALRTLTALGRLKPSIRRLMPLSWRIIDRWCSEEPCVHHKPIPHMIFRAVVAIALGWGWDSFAAIVIITYFGPGRVGEPLRQCRRDLVLPSDVLDFCRPAAYLCIRRPKTAKRGGAAAQTVQIEGDLEIQFLEEFARSLAPGSPLSPLSVPSFRKQWDRILTTALGIPAKHGFLPSGLRGGGAVHQFTDLKLDIATLQYRMRIKDQQTLRHYLQEAITMSTLIELSSESKTNIVAAQTFYEPLLSSYRNPAVK